MIGSPNSKLGGNIKPPFCKSSNAISTSNSNLFCKTLWQTFHSVVHTIGSIICNTKAQSA